MNSFLQHSNFLLVILVLLHELDQPLFHGTDSDRVLFVLLLVGLNVLLVLLVPVLGLGGQLGAQLQFLRLQGLDPGLQFLLDGLVFVNLVDSGGGLL